ncbi:MAG: polysaccharide pyruvyl transferase CsaB [Clostridia bacterium]|nr:polysaccharide pyruvyl transferase CsaB [Clostridia bacterium]
MKVLMATMQLDIGGAETHIVELSKALARKGVEVFVASNGGAYVKELEDAGIKHFTVPLNRKNPRSLKTAYKLLEKIILDSGIDIVHAHARIPGFLCGLLHKKLNFRFVSTAHWVFNTRFPLNLLTNWGERSLTVSDDIKKYLIDKYGCKAENIGVTINGVDTDKFSANIDYSDIADEFGFGEDKTRIVYVSRMDIDRSFAAHKLIEAVPRLLKSIPSLEVVVVGGGNDFDQIKKEADRTNEQLGKKVIITTGARTDINKFAASCDVFVGVSRAALEAMACKKPAIIAGNEGYIGIFDEDKLGVAIDTNFCCRGCEETTTERLYEDLLKVLAKDKNVYRARLGEYSLETVKKHYSVDTMANDALRMYAAVAKDSAFDADLVPEIKDIEKYLLCGGKRPVDVVISGYYGFRNSGDDSILTAIISELREVCPNISITVLSKNPAETSRLYSVDSVDRLDFLKLWQLFAKTKLLISGGGSLIQDVTSSKSLYYYLAVMRLAKLRGAKVMLYANGIGPVTRAKNFEHIRKTLKSASYITLRDLPSKDELSQILLPEVPCEVTADPVFSLPVAEKETVDKALLSCGVSPDEKVFLVSVRDWKTLDKDFESKICEFCEFVHTLYGIRPLIVPMQKTFDKEISERIFKLLKVPAAISPGGFSPELMPGIAKRCEFVLGMRLHSLIYAVKAGVPSIALDYDPKVASVMKSIGLEFVEPVDRVDVTNLCGFAQRIMEKQVELCADMQKKSNDFALLSKKNTEIAVNLLKNL